QESAKRAIEPKPADAAKPADEASHRDHVVLLGHGSVGSILAAFLQQRGASIVVVEQDRTLVKALRRRGVRALHGHGEDPEVMERAGIGNARMLLVTTTQPVAARRAIEHAHRSNPRIEVITRVHQDSLMRAVSELPRTRVVRGDIELAFAMARFMLLQSGVSAVETEMLIFDARRGESDISPPRVG